MVGNKTIAIGLYHRSTEYGEYAYPPTALSRGKKGNQPSCFLSSELDSQQMPR